MSIHTVVEDEWIGSIAAAEGHYSWEAIWGHARNKLLDIRRNPNLLVVGDEIWIPPVEVRGASTVTAMLHRLVVSSPKNKLVIRFTRITRYVANFGPIRVTLKVGRSRKRGTLNKDGDQIEAYLPLKATEATLTIKGASATLHIGNLRPLARMDGMQARITNLGWDVGKIDNQDGPRTQRGVKGFQGCYKIKVDGVIGDQTRSKAKEVYGC